MSVILLGLVLLAVTTVEVSYVTEVKLSVQTVTFSADVAPVGICNSALVSVLTSDQSRIQEVAELILFGIASHVTFFG